MVSEDAPLISIPELPVPKGGKAEWFSGEDGARLRAALYPAKGKARGSVVVSPGRVEPIEKYHEVVGELQARGFVVLVHDWRGQGLSDRMLADRLKGHAKGAELFRSDYTRLLDHFEDRLPKPWIQMGHSMGGGLSLYALVRDERRLAAAAYSAPMFGPNLGNVPEPLARFLAWLNSRIGLAGAYVPSAQPDPGKVTFESDHIAHDRPRWERFRALLKACPDLKIGYLTWGWLDFALTMTQELQSASQIAAIDIPVLIVTSGDDDRVRTEDSRAIADRLPNSTYIEIEEAWHEILMETDDIRAIWWAAFDALVEKIVS